MKNEKRLKKRQTRQHQQQKFTSSLSSLFRHNDVSSEVCNTTEKINNLGNVSDRKHESQGSSFIRSASGESRFLLNTYLSLNLSRNYVNNRDGP